MFFYICEDHFPTLDLQREDVFGKWWHCCTIFREVKCSGFGSQLLWLRMWQEIQHAVRVLTSSLLYTHAPTYTCVRMRSIVQATSTTHCDPMQAAAGRCPWCWNGTLAWARTGALIPGTTQALSPSKQVTRNERDQTWSAEFSLTRSTDSYRKCNGA